ncbi:MAG: hypothetical protein IH597_15665 [Bacteroidales bacterium]|nr:hypothetical protein [Bacteroidales bacterium]
MTKKLFLLLFTVLVVVILSIQSCATYQFRSTYKETNSLIHETANLQTRPFLKAHLKNGDICILSDTWNIDTVQNQVSGSGQMFDFNRNSVFEGELSIPIDSVAIFETNTKLVKPEAGRVTALSIMAGVDAIIGVLCLINPKACFGSCPTFYMNEHDNFHYADAEGFTNAISPSMEYFDIDALNNKPLTGNTFSLTMKNEALETHCVNEVKLLAYPRYEHERVYQSPVNDFYLCENLYRVKKASAEEGDITPLINHDDNIERFSLSDPNNLNSKEEIYFDFGSIDNIDNLGLVLNFRQALMTTYLFYSAMGYMGDEVSDMFAMLETDPDMREKFDATSKLMGGIDVFMWNERFNDWQFQDSFYETGPIAINKQFIPVGRLDSDAGVRIKLILNKGLWRLDYIALTNIIRQVEPIEIKPDNILSKGEPNPQALKKISDPESYLISMPGDEYKFNFTLPQENADYELFLYSKGYYLEWMREHWLKDKDLTKLAQMVYAPESFLKAEARDFKIYESSMEQAFWNSRIDTKTFSYHEE